MIGLSGPSFSACIRMAPNWLSEVSISTINGGASGLVSGEDKMHRGESKAFLSVSSAVWASPVQLHCFPWLASLMVALG